MEASIIQFVTVLGAAGALLWVLNQIIAGKLHSSSEVDGLKQDKADLLDIVQSQGEALRKTNEADKQIIRLLRGKQE